MITEPIEINFHINYNNKLHCDIFTTNRLTKKLYPGTYS